MRHLAALPLAFPVFLAMAGPAAGVDGVVEINAARAAAGGVTPGDAPGFPVTLSVGGSYRLTSDLITSNRANTLVEITAPRVSLDLNGFTVGACLGGGICGTGSGYGIDANGILDISVRNGTVAHAGGTCVRVWSRALLEDLRITDCGMWGVQAGPDSRIAHVSVSSCSSIGILITSGIVRDSVSADNGGPGISLSLSTLLVDSMIHDNQGAILGPNSVSTRAPGYRGCVIDGNDGANEVQPISVGVRNLGNNLCGSDTTCP